MGVRRSVWKQLHGFDCQFGARGRFVSAEELDFIVRALLAGHSAYAPPEVRVVHFGFRSWASGRTLIQGYLFGIGAMFAKQLKGGHLSILLLMFQLAWQWAFHEPGP